MTEQDKDRQLDNVYQKVFRYSVELALKFEWQMIAATLIAIGLRLYKTIGSTPLTTGATLFKFN